MELRVSGDSQGRVTEERQLHRKRISISAVCPLQVRLARSLGTCRYRGSTVLQHFILGTRAPADFGVGEGGGWEVLEPIGYGGTQLFVVSLNC